MRRRDYVTIVTAACMLLHALPAQSSPKRARRTATSIAVHKAWLQEVVDLDRKGAVEAYDKILKDNPRTQPERWIAVVRLEELSRLGVLRPEPRTTPHMAPQAVQDAIAELVTLVPFAKVLANPTQKRDLPSLRPATRMVQSWVRNQIGPTVRDRLRADQDRFRADETTRNTEAADWRRRWHVYDVLSRELEGNRTQAEALRTYYFANWKPPEVTGAPAAVVKEAQKRLAAWIETEKSSQRRAVLRELQKAIGTRTNNDAATAIAFISRLPDYASKLLGPEPSTDPDEKR